MKKINFKSRKIHISIFLILILIISPLVNSEYTNSNTIDLNNIKFSQNFSKPIIFTEDNLIKIELGESNSFISVEGHPKLPFLQKYLNYNLDQN